eukprot:CAMPEP_0202977936 /NCGR_PEP_ID=MMETSP1396-20130829/84540_1 /ASSEMBLY_ACC=CAM_ASM_000872 /TAXON_ID= /ORGANISM="Pseudokeronopsis sp., Strain Brazil" /LENGTH=43 /DNA_ID= /DNA_START= /DNA_END= /DNA_ORIENTATION=
MVKQRSDLFQYDDEEEKGDRRVHTDPSSLPSNNLNQRSKLGSI